MVLAIFSLFLSFPKNTKAGVFSFVTGLFATQAASTEVDISDTQNSQTMPVLQAATNSDPNPTKGGTDLSIVGGNAIETTAGPSGTASEIKDKANGDQISVYTVHAGDTLADIAKMFDVTPNTILWANDLKSAKDIKKDQNIIILPISGVKYVVKKGDTLKSIATSFKGDVDEIMRFNDLDENSKISVGDEIIIPDGEISAPEPSKTSTKVQTGGSLVDTSGYFTRPISGGIRTQGLHGGCHCAVDLANVIGTPVHAAAAGRVIIAIMGGWHGGYGNYIVISHSNGTQTLYAHLSKILVSPGDVVGKGDQIGNVGTTGNSTGPHLHFEVRGGRNPF